MTRPKTLITRPMPWRPHLDVRAQTLGQAQRLGTLLTLMHGSGWRRRAAALGRLFTRHSHPQEQNHG